MTLSVDIPVGVNPASISNTLNAENSVEERDYTSFKRRIEYILSLPENKFCVDCSRPSPRWVSLVAIDSQLLGLDENWFSSKENNHFLKRSCSNLSAKRGLGQGLLYDNSVPLPLGCFCCLDCSGTHRRLGTHITFVRSIDLDAFKEREVLALECAGNAIVNGIFEANMLQTLQDYDTGAVRVSYRGLSERGVGKSNHRGTSGTHITEEEKGSREAFIRDKYEKKLFMDLSALRRYYAHPSPTICGSTSFTAPETPYASTASDTESACVASVPDTSSDLQLRMFTSCPKTMEAINKYMRENPFSSSVPNNERLSTHHHGKGLHSPSRDKVSGQRRVKRPINHGRHRKDKSESANNSVTGDSVDPHDGQSPRVDSVIPSSVPGSILVDLKGLQITDTSIDGDACETLDSMGHRSFRLRFRSDNRHTPSLRSQFEEIDLGTKSDSSHKTFKLSRSPTKKKSPVKCSSRKKSMPMVQMDDRGGSDDGIIDKTKMDNYEWESPLLGKKIICSLNDEDETLEYEVIYPVHMTEKDDSRGASSGFGRLFLNRFKSSKSHHVSLDSYQYEDSNGSRKR